MQAMTCTKCHQQLLETDFGVNTKHGKQYRRTECKRCLRERSRHNTALIVARPLGWKNELRALRGVP